LTVEQLSRRMIRSCVVGLEELGSGVGDSRGIVTRHLGASVGPDFRWTLQLDGVQCGRAVILNGVATVKVLVGCRICREFYELVTNKE
jgi:hypothetical protein